MANTIKRPKGLEQMLQRELLMPSIYEAALMTPDELKERVREINELTTNKPN